ncbi:DUF3644 domain-containing protein [Gordonia sp. DT218]|uniref:DUF3644 domain-containing protein n=1 Tax=Gordonia sp. DT218 TaxID=3416659 RepID=UPI003CF42C18
MPRESYNVRILRGKAIASLRTGVTAFNGLDDSGRTTTVLLSFQHAFEMLLKAVLEAKKDKGVFDKRSQKSISLDKAINRCQQIEGVKLTDDEAGVIRHLDAMRDAEQHWHLVVDEGLLFHNARSAVTLFDDLLQRVFDEHLSKYIPTRVLPISAEAPMTLDLLVDREFQRIADLLRPGRRATEEAKARVRALLATEAVADADAAEVREDDVRRVTRGIREGKSRAQVFPKLTGYTSEIEGDGVAVEVRIVKKEGLPITYTDDPTADTAAIRTVDLERKFHMGARDLADKAGIGKSRAVALRRHLGLDDDDDHFSHRFRFGGMEHRRYSDNALKAMRQAVKTIDLEKVWQSHRTIPYNSEIVPPACDQPGCAISALKDLP